jgi:1,4-dihydroxy-2-naphthoate octaprenyltransferase
MEPAAFLKEKADREQMKLTELLRPFIRDTLRLAFDLRAWRAGTIALRAPSLVIAGFSCALGVLLAYHDGRGNLLNAICVIVDGLALQAGVNLVNDFFEFRQKKVGDKVAHLGFVRADRELLEWLIFLVGLAFFGFAGLVGLFLVWRSGWPLLVLGSVGFAGGFFYTGEPLNYKRRGLAVVIVFFLMGMFMVAGSYYAVAGLFSWKILPASVPVSLLVSLILLANEIRDFESDSRYKVRTLAVRIGYPRAILAYCILLVCAYASPVLLRLGGLFPSPWLAYLALPFAVPPFLFMHRAPEKRKAIIPFVMLHHLVFGFLFCVTLYLPGGPVRGG